MAKPSFFAKFSFLAKLISAIAPAVFKQDSKVADIANAAGLAADTVEEAKQKGLL